ncbi:hypothetical protein DUNSADRAFT_10373 [Dunaliella salina]|uniref:Uncharacterized protein n=1 Tax=Dunaliella salina TaxID=3046 RepID=A0ABQ7GFJ1_DUNSA|nr:hypothetical protein DUNSADRAFT_10373 [Dunaliella salina]|eukprot:KAF5833372.1 hypothetical protein DUNSADRAFT_10373 [Dunaliella salina]
MTDELRPVMPGVCVTMRCVAVRQGVLAVGSASAVVCCFP